jgi:hypothetical protein
MRRALTLATTIALFGFGACLFDPEDAEGLICNFDDECGPELDCIDRLCRKPGDVAGPETMSGGDPSGGATAPGEGGEDGPTPPDDGGGGGASCPYTNDGECDEPEGTNLCAPGTDVNDCAGGGDGCNPSCSAGQTCIAGTCVGDSPSTCGTNVSSTNATCDACAHANCCDELQACFGDETVVSETVCLQLNNCIASFCNSATTLEELQSCVNSSCPGAAGQLNTWLDYNACLSEACASQC